VTVNRLDFTTYIYKQSCPMTTTFLVSQIKNELHFFLFFICFKKNAKYHKIIDYTKKCIESIIDLTLLKNSIKKKKF